MSHCAVLNLGRATPLRREKSSPEELFELAVGSGFVAVGDTSGGDTGKALNFSHAAGVGRPISTGGEVSPVIAVTADICSEVEVQLHDAKAVPRSCVSQVVPI